MKKIIIFLAFMILILCIIKKETSEEMIRFRIIANSNEEQDQLEKKKVLKSIAQDLLKNNPATKQEEETYLKENIPNMKETIKEVIEENEKFQISYGNHYFPEKEYNGITYPEGEYESLVITLGEGKGDNFWCILFPPLCMMEEEDIEYKSWIKEALEKLF